MIFNYIKSTSTRLILLIILSGFFLSCSDEESIIRDLQQQLNSGELPENLIQKRRYEAVNFIGLSFQGGVIYDINDAGQTWIIASNDIGPQGGSPWGCKSVTTGSINSFDAEESAQKILLADCLSIEDAAQLAYDYSAESFDDWLLPTTDDFSVIYRQLSPRGFIFSDEYWSATEVNADEAQIANYRGSDQRGVRFDIEFKDELASVRPIRIYKP